MSSKRFWLGFGDVKVGQAFTWNNPWTTASVTDRMVKVSSRKYQVLESANVSNVGVIFQAAANAGVRIDYGTTTK